MFYNILAHAHVDEDDKGFRDMMRDNSYCDENNIEYYSPAEFKCTIGVNKWRWNRKQYNFKLTYSMPIRFFDDYCDASGYIMETLIEYISKATKMLKEHYDIDTACKIIQDEIRIMLPIKLKLLRV